MSGFPGEELKEGTKLTPERTASLLGHTTTDTTLQTANSRGPEALPAGALSSSRVK